ncbi:hypothetical protein EV182_005853, partial [Spiromyces aspiralis]
MDDTHSQVVRDAFIQLFEDKLIYRDTRMVNWCCALQSVISDIETDHIFIDKPTYLSVPGHSKKVEFGVLHRIAYPVIDPVPSGLDTLVVATTRPETLLGDVAVAIHPEDPRYKSLHTKHLRHPILKTPIPIVLDAELVDPAFGTGAVK